MKLSSNLSTLRMFVAVSVTAALLAACSSGGGSSQGTSPAGAVNTQNPQTGAPAGKSSDCLANSFEVQSYYGSYDVSTKKAGQPAKSLGEAKSEKWERPAKANKPYTIGVVLPHLKDPYWLAVDYGIVAEARCLGVGIELVAAKGYDDLTGQINLAEELANRGIDGMILGGVSYAGQDQLVATLTGKFPVFEVINDIQAPKITGKALVSFYQMGYTAGQFVVEDAKSKTKVKVGFLPGPAGSGWAPDTVDGFKDAVQKAAPGKVDIVDIQWGDTGKEAQRTIAENMMSGHPDLDYIVGTASAVDAAVDVVAPLKNKPKIVATHLNPPVWDQIKAGKIAAGPSDWTAIQGRMAVDMLVKNLNGSKPGSDMPFRSGPVIKIVTTDNLGSMSHDDNFGPENVQPVFKVSPKK